MMKKIKLIDRIIEFVIKSKPADFAGLNVNAIARSLNVSVSHLSRDFKKNMKICLHEYLQREKIKRACFLLKQNRRLTVNDVSQILDFCSCDYFIRIFKQHVGTTPGEFRKMDEGFYGLCDRRRGPVDRRIVVRDGRSGSQTRKVTLASSSSRIFKLRTPNKNRHSPVERRKGSGDRRKVLGQTNPEF